MKILILSLSYHPDSVSLAQHQTDLAESLVASGHQVTVLTSIFGYDSGEKFKKNELHNGVKIERFFHTNFGKKSFLFRVINYFSFNFVLFFKTLFYKSSADIIVGVTSPPFSALIGIVISKMRKIPYCYWVMDLQPELAIASGLIKKGSLSNKFFLYLGNHIIRNSAHIISLDRFMTNYLISRGAIRENISEIPVWPVSEGIYNGDRATNPFRLDNNFGDRFVIMFSGNHAHVHPLDTLLHASERLNHDKRFLFSFIGSGVRKEDVSRFKNIKKLTNISQQAFQPRSTFHISIGASDIQVVIMGDGQVGYTHPNKIYGAMFLGKPILYIGPLESHVTDILAHLEGNIIVKHGDVDSLVAQLLDFAELSLEVINEIGVNNKIFANKNFNSALLRNSMVNCIQKLER